MINKNKARKKIYLLAFLRTLQGALTLFTYAAILKEILGENMTLAAYSIRAAIVVLLLIAISLWRKPLEQPKKFFLSSTILMVTGVVLLLLTTHPFLVITGFTLHLLGAMFVLLTLDEFIEQLSDDKHTGSIRGSFLTALNAARFVGPLAAGFLLQTFDTWVLFACVLTIMVLLFIVGAQILPTDPVLKKNSPNKSFASVFKSRLGVIYLLLKNKVLRFTLLINFLLQCFYIVSVLFLALGLQQYVGASWNQIGLAITIMLVPFLFLQIPLGKLADNVLGEVELTIAGALIICASMLGLLFVFKISLIWWVVFLFISRVGATAVETMSESYYYKHIDSSDVSAITLLRTTFPFGYLLTAAICLALLAVPGIEIIHLFGISGALMLFAIPLALQLPDTK